MAEVADNKIYKASAINYYLVAIVAVLGYLSTLSLVVVSIAWLFVVLGCLYGLFFRKMEYVWYGIAASPFMELWGRLVKHAPFLPMEMGKYFLMLCIIIVFADQFLKNKNARLYNTGMLIIFFLLPSLFVNLSDFSRDQWVFNILSLLEMCFLLILTSKERWDIDRFCRTLQIGVIPIIAILVFLTVSTPDYGEINFALGANSDASGGFGSNQVSTILGLGIVFIMLLVLLKRPFFPIIWLNYLLLGYLLFRGLLTFSRGGMIGATLAVIIALIPVLFSSMKYFVRNMVVLIVLVILGFFIFSKVNDITGNQLVLRYEGETTDTKAGHKDKTLNTATSGRSNIIAADIGIFMDNFMFGVGPGGAKELRTDYGLEEATAAHIEFTRLLSEHGLGGVGVIAIMLIFPFVWVRKQNLGIWKGVSAGLFTIAIFTCLHSAMRTNTTAVCYALAAMPIMLNKRWMAQLKSDA